MYLNKNLQFTYKFEEMCLTVFNGQYFIADRIDKNNL